MTVDRTMHRHEASVGDQLCTTGRCAQPECASNRVVVDISTTDVNSDSDSDSESQSTVILPATESQQPHDDHRSPDVRAVPHSSHPSPLSGVRRAVDGVHVDEEVCVGPQADTHASSAAAYRQPSATVVDSRSVASQEVGDTDEGGVPTHTAGSGGDIVHSAPTVAVATVDRPLPSAVLRHLPHLSHQPRRLPVIADGRCSVASFLLAFGQLPDAHDTENGKRAIDRERRWLGQCMEDTWTEADWVRRVPLHLRGAHMPYDTTDLTGNRRQRSYDVYRRLLREGPVIEWLDPCVLYLASYHYNVGIFLIYTTMDEHWHCSWIRRESERHMVLYQVCGHYEAVEYNGRRLLPSSHEFVRQMARFADEPPPDYPYEEDGELQVLQSSTANAAAATSQRGGGPHKDSPKRRARKGKASAAHDPADRNTAAAAQPSGGNVNTATGSGVQQLPPLVAQVAEHGPLYERVSFHNHPQWRAANEPLWNAYRLASMTGQRSRLTAILLDILRLPQRVLPKLGRSGRAARRRATTATKHRMRSEAERLRERYNCPDPNPKDGQETQMSVDTMAHTTAQGGYERPKRAASIAAAEAIRRQAADTTDTDAGELSAADDAADSDDEGDDPCPSLSRPTKRHSADPDSKAARKASYLVQCGLTRKAAQVLHSTTQIADLRTAAAQETMLRLHPRQPSDTVLPALPEGAPPSVLEDDAGMRRLLIQSDNGTSAGPSGWGGNMLALLVQSDICRLGVIALLRDIVNGELPDDARQLLLASRLVALTKPNSDGYRPIAVGELFYRLAAIVAVRRVSTAAARLLAPHQYGMGVAAGAEKIIHSLQHELADTDKRQAMLQLDMSNAFNSCDRARLLRELYGLPDLQPLFRIADFAYNQPSALVLSGCDGLMIESAQGVRQGDPLSALLFCIYMRDTLQQVSAETGAKVYGFFDDINLVGTPQQLMAALSCLQQSLPAVSLQLNTAKSHFAYFHDSLTPLTSAVLSTLSANDIQLHHDWVGVVGAVVGRDDAAIRAGVHSVLSAAGGHDAFHRRLRLDEMPIQTAMLLLRQCMVPSMNYFLRCIAPACIEDDAHRFDQRVIEAAADKLGLDEAERGERTATLLQRKLRDGGWGLTAAVCTSAAAFLGSLATCHAEPTFVGYSGDTPLPSTSMLHGWIEDSMQRVRRVAPGAEYQTDIQTLLPDTAGAFFHHYSTVDGHPSVTTKLQHSLNAKATSQTIKAAIEWMKQQSRQGKKWQWAHHKASTAKGAWGWKAVRPDDPRLRLSDVEYAIAARLNLDLKPFPARTMAALPEHCPLCRHNRTVSLNDDPWHWLTCGKLVNGELRRRHDAVVDAIGRLAGQIGAQVRTEVGGLDPNSRQRPDMQIVFPGRMMLTDVVVSHSLTTSTVANNKSAAALWQGRKDRKYTGLASRLGAELLNVSVDTCGGMADGTWRLVEAIGEEGERWSMGTWNSTNIQRRLLGTIAMAVQRGNAMAMLLGHTRTAQVHGAAKEGETVVEEREGDSAVEGVRW